MNRKDYPTKKAKYSGKLTPLEGEAVVYMPDDSVIMATEIFAGVIRGDYASCPKEIEFFIPRENDGN